MTSILDLLDEENVAKTLVIPEGKEKEFILDLSIPVNSRIDVFNNYFIQNESGAIEILRQLNSMWYMCGIKAIENFFIAVCNSRNISSILKLSVVKSLISEEEGTVNKTSIQNALNSILQNGNLPTPCRVETIQLLMNYESLDSPENSTSKYFEDFLKDHTIDEEFRYKTILNLENLSATWMRDQLLTLFPNKEFVKHIFTICKDLIKQEFPKFIPQVDNEEFFELLLLRINYDKLSDNYKEYCTSTINIYNFFIREAQLCFIQDNYNSIYYRILSAQYLLQKCQIENPETIEDILLSFAEDHTNTENQRADAADTLLHLGSADMKLKGRNIILFLGIGEQERNNLFTNTQNVHNTDVEDSISEIMEFFAQQPTQLINKIPITFQEVRKNIEYIGGVTKKIQLSLNRINIDRALYSKFNISLETLLVKVWSYVKKHKNEQELLKRLLEELEDMSGTCSTGFASRLVNIVSGFGEFNIRISWEDQIVANFTGRLNAKARVIQDEQSIFRTKYYQDVANIQPDIDDIIESFSQAVLEELPIKSSEPDKRKNFNLFLRCSISDIRDEMYLEFTEFLDDTTFDLYIRKALMHYEGEF